MPTAASITPRDANYNGADSFSYTVTDDEGNVSNVATVNLTIDNTQEPPVAVDDAATTAEDTAVTINVLANDSDPDGALVPGTVTIAGQPANGSVVVNADGTVTYTPDANYNGADSFSYTVTDDEGQRLERGHRQSDHRQHPGAAGGGR